MGSLLQIREKVPPRIGLEACAVALLASACAARSPLPAAPGAPSADVYGVGWTQTGIASWYGEPFHGRRTASGAVYDMEKMTAAHRALPFGTRIRVENVDNGRSTEVEVNDRGPFARGRILDVSHAAARALGMIGPGTARVRITILDPGDPLVSPRGGCVVVQVAAFRDRRVARQRLAEIETAGFTGRIERHEGWHRVVAGPYDKEADVRRAVAGLGGFVRRCSL